MSKRKPATRRCKMAGAKSEITTDRERRAWEFRLKGWTQARIAAELKIDRSTVGKMLDRIEQRTLAELSERVEQHKALQTARLEEIFREAIEGWVRSQQDAVTIKTTEDGVERTVKGQAGTAAFLAEGRAALADIRKIWGIDAKPDDRPADVSPIDPRIAEAAIAAALATDRAIKGAADAGK